MDPKNLFDRAVGLHQEGRLDEAGELYRQLLSADPQNRQVHYLFALLLFQQQQIPDAMESIATAHALDPGAPEILVLQGAIFEAAGRPLDALESFAKVTALEPGNDEAWYNRGVLALNLRRLDEALAAFDRTLELKPESAEAWNNRGVALHGLRRYDEEISAYDKALALRPDYVEAWNNRAGALQSLGRFEEAIADYDRALALDPGYAEAWSNRAVTLTDMQRFDEALESLDRAEAVYPDYPAALFNHAQILNELHASEEAMTLFARHAEIVYGAGPVSTPADSPHKQKHDSEQREYLAAHGVEAPEGIYFAGGARLPSSAINPANALEVTAQWEQSRPQIVVIDDLLTPAALEGLRRFCRGSTIWRRSYEDGYLGAMPESGFACPLLAQIDEEFRAVFPAIFGSHGLRMFWGFKYDSALSGIRIHADQAAVNVNFWITPDEANLNPQNGGLVVWDKSAPLDWDILTYNGDENAIRAFLAKAGARKVTVPYRANRAVIFDSDLFHETDKIEFRDGYRNRRINITMLYGRRTFHGD